MTNTTNTTNTTETTDTTENDIIDTDTYEKYEALFITFLKIHGAYEKYCSNLPNPKAKGFFTPDDLGTNEFNDRYMNFLYFGSVWRNTPEGYDYWRNLLILWNQFLMRTKEKAF